jgi:hypothetical protein
MIAFTHCGWPGRDPGLWRLLGASRIPSAYRRRRSLASIVISLGDGFQPIGTFFYSSGCRRAGCIRVSSSTSASSLRLIPKRHPMPVPTIRHHSIDRTSLDYRRSSRFQPPVSGSCQCGWALPMMVDPIIDGHVDVDDDASQFAFGGVGRIGNPLHPLLDAHWAVSALAFAFTSPHPLPHIN